MVGGIVYSVVAVHTILTCQVGYGVSSKVGQTSTYSKVNRHKCCVDKKIGTILEKDN